jgi:TetR/AcrR family transcriptional regulator, cholesterol catabolism regulator
MASTTGRVATKRATGRSATGNGRAPDENSLTPKQSDRRRRVIEAAISLATKGGYDAVQMRDVAAEARVALGTLYRYFPSKDQLLVAALNEWAENLRDKQRARPQKGATKADRVAGVLRGTVRAMERQPKLSAAFVTALSSMDAEEPGSIERAAQVYQTMSEMIGQAMNGDALPDQDMLMRVLGQVWFAVLVFWVRGWSPGNQMADDLDAAAHLMIRD